MGIETNADGTTVKETTDTTKTDVAEKTENDLFSDTDENDVKQEDTKTDPKKSTDEGQPGGEEEESSKRQSREDNRKYAEMRREKERQEKERQEIERKAYRKGLIEAINGVNPYTNKKIEDDFDVEEYMTMREIEKDGLDPVADYSAYLKKKKRLETAPPTSGVRSQEWLENDARQFLQKYPEVNLETLLDDKLFVKFSDGKLGNQTLARVYEDYTELMETLNAETDKKIRLAVARGKSSPGSVETGKTTEDSTYYSWEQLQKMSTKEVDKNYDKVMKSYNYHLQKGR